MTSFGVIGSKSVVEVESENCSEIQSLVSFYYYYYSTLRMQDEEEDAEEPDAFYKPSDVS